MNVLIIGGTGVISSAVTRVVQSQANCFVLNRGHRQGTAPGVTSLIADINDPENVKAVLPDIHFDSVVNFINFNPSQIERDIALFSGRTSQYVFISSASVYQKPLSGYCVTESTPLVNPYWEYSRNKIACEERLMQQYRNNGFPAVIVRPSLTYNEQLIPLVLNSWNKSYTVVDRIKKGKPVIVPGDGTSLWTITHAADFALGLCGLLGNYQTIGHSFHITSDEVLTWDQIYDEVGLAVGCEVDIVHMSSDQIVSFAPGESGSLLGDKSVSAVFDNSKIKKFVPSFRPSVSWAQGVRRSIAWFEQDTQRIQIDDNANATWDLMIAAHNELLEKGRTAAQRNAW